MHVPFFHVSRGGGKYVYCKSSPRQCLGPPAPEYVRARIGICGVVGGRGLGATDGFGVAIGPKTPSALQLALVCGSGVKPIIPSWVSVIVVGTSVAPDTMLLPLYTSPRSKSVPFNSAFAATISSPSPTLAACARLICMTGVVGARTSMAVASEIAMKRRRETDDAMRMMRRGMDDIAVVLHYFWRFGRLKGYATMSKFVGDAKKASGVATLRVSSPRFLQTSSQACRQPYHASLKAVYRLLTTFGCLMLRECASSREQRLRPIFVGSVTNPSPDPYTARYQPLLAIAWITHLNYIWAFHCHVAKAALTI